MIRRLSLLLFKRALVATLLLCLGCAAQSSSADLDRRIERQVRTFYSLPGDVRVELGPRTPDNTFPNYDKMTITFTQGSKVQKEDFLIARDGALLLRVTKIDISKDPYVDVMNHINVSGRPVRGARDAKVVIVNYDDFQCPFCARMYQTLFSDVMKQYGDRVKVIAKDYPLSEIHPWAEHAAIDANCLGDQNNDAYWDYADYIHANQHDINIIQVDVVPTDGKNPDAAKEALAKKKLDAQFDKLDKVTLDFGQKRGMDLSKLQACVKQQSSAALDASMEEGKKLHIEATPTFFINGEKFDGAIPPEDLRAILDRALKEAGQPVPASRETKNSGN